MKKGKPKFLTFGGLKEGDYFRFPKTPMHTVFIKRSRGWYVNIGTRKMARTGKNAMVFPAEYQPVVKPAPVVPAVTSSTTSSTYTTGRMASIVSTNAEVLISLGGSQYIVKVDHSIPAGEIHIGRFAALDALVEATGHVQPTVTVTVPKTRTRHEEKEFYMLRVRAEEQAAARDWLHKNGQTLSEMERKVMAASFPTNKIGMLGSALVAEAVGIGPAVVRRIRNAVLRRAGVLAR